MSGDRRHFLVIGAMKSGTTSIFRDLCDHPGVFGPAVKEPGDLVEDAVLSPQGRARYLGLFDPAPSGVWCGEASTIYTKLPEAGGAPARAREVLGPDLRLVFVGRDPVERLRSHYRHEVQLGSFDMPLSEALDRHPPLRDVSRYDMQLAQWLDRYPRGQLLVLRYEDYAADAQALVDRIWRFLGLEPVPLQARGAANVSAGKRVPKGALRRVITSDLYARGVKRFLPDSLRQGVKSLVVPKGRETFDMALDPAREAALRAELDAATARFRAMAEEDAALPAAP